MPATTQSVGDKESSMDTLNIWVRLDSMICILHSHVPRLFDRQPIFRLAGESWGFIQARREVYIYLQWCRCDQWERRVRIAPAFMKNEQGGWMIIRSQPIGLREHMSILGRTRWTSISQVNLSWSSQWTCKINSPRQRGKRRLLVRTFISILLSVNVNGASWWEPGFRYSYTWEFTSQIKCHQ